MAAVLRNDRATRLIFDATRSSGRTRIAARRDRIVSGGCPHSHRSGKHELACWPLSVFSRLARQADSIGEHLYAAAGSLSEPAAR